MELYVFTKVNKAWQDGGDWSDMIAMSYYKVYVRYDQQKMDTYSEFEKKYEIDHCDKEHNNWETYIMIK